MYSALKLVILHSIRSLPIEPYISKVADVQDFDKSLLLSQLKLLPKLVDGMTINTVAEFVAWLSANFC